MRPESVRPESGCLVWVLLVADCPVCRGWVVLAVEHRVLAVVVLRSKALSIKLKFAFAD